MHRSTVAGAAWQVALLVGLVAVAGYFLLPGEGAKDAGYSVIGVGSVACVIVGIRWHRPADRWGWQAVTAGNLCFVLGDGVYDVYQFGLHRAIPFPSVADAFYLAGYPFLILGVVYLTGRRPGGGNGVREGLADAGIVTIGALALSWHFVMGSYATDATAGALAKGVALAYPVMDLGVLFIVAQGLIFGAARRATHVFLAAAMVAMVVADSVYDVLVLHGGYSVGNPVDAGWLINYVLVGVAALHPTMAAPTNGATRETSADAGARRLPLIALAGFVPPGILLASAITGRRADATAMALCSMALFALVVQRMRWLFHEATEQAATLRRSLSRRQSLEVELRHQALHDSLTGLANRALLDDRVQQALARAPRAGLAVALCFCDLDGFKTVNDSLGHQAGDDMLVAAGKRLAAVVRPGDTVARLGGDEFAVLLEHIDDPAAATAVAERIVSVMRQPVAVQGRPIATSVSVGVAVATTGTTAAQLLREADAAMYEAKAAGKDRLAVFEADMHDKIVERLELINALVGALGRDELYLDYQPQFSLTDRRLTGFEALLRWRHPGAGIIAPDRFVPLAEETGLIVPIGRWVIEQACHQGALWATSQPSLTVSVNLSARQLRDAGLVGDVRAALSSSGLRPDRLVLEVTESVLMDDAGRGREVLAELKAAGIKLAIDDFGTGYSSLTYLRQLPVDILKIDKSFVDPLRDLDGEGPAFVATIIALAHDLGLATVAEGLEHSEQQAALTRLGCDQAQGYLLGRPADIAAATRLAAGHAALARPQRGQQREAPLMAEADR